MPKSISTSVDEVTWQALKDEAEAQDRTFSAQCARILRQWATYAKAEDEGLVDTDPETEDGAPGDSVPPAPALQVDPTQAY